MEETAAIKLQSFNRGKTTRKHTKRLQLYKNLPDDLQSIINKEYNKIDILKRENNQLLLEGAKEGNLSKVKYALDNYADIETINKGGNIELHWRRALHWASIRGHTEVVNVLLEKGADVDAAAMSNTALHYASVWGHPPVIRLLLDAGADIEAKASNGETALWKASYHWGIDAVRLLLEKGANVDVKGWKGKTALHWATFNYNDEIVRLLLEAGANVDEKDEDGYTALCFTHKGSKIEELLRSWGATDGKKKQKKKTKKSKSKKSR